MIRTSQFAASLAAVAVVSLVATGAFAVDTGSADFTRYVASGTASAPASTAAD